MSVVKICRICLRKDVKMYEYDRFQLKFYYKEVTGSSISKRDCLPKWFCFECAALLYKFHEFKRKCHGGQKAFKKLLKTGCTNIENFNRRSKLTNIQSHLQILSASTNKNIKTYSVEHGRIHHKESKIYKKKKKYKSFTEVFVDDVKTDLHTEINTIKKRIFKHKRPTVIKSLNEEKWNQSIDNDDSHVHNEDSNDSILINNENDSQNDFKEETIDTEANINDVADITNNIEQQISYEEQTNHDKERINITIEIPSYDEAKTSPVMDRTNHDEQRTTTCVIKSTTNLSPLKPNLDNKFQRSVKKKFLDENHWTKITLTDEEATRRFQSKALEQKYLRADFKCRDCYRTFSQEDMMKRHVKLRHCESLGPNECRHCRMRFKWKSRLQKHLKEHYNIYKCLRCELSFPVEISAFQHDYSHNGVTWTCAHCGQGFRHSSTYYTHLRKHKSAHVCSLCGVSFVSEFGLFMHKRVKHVINQDCKEENSNTYCKVCDIKFDTLKGYEEHFAESALHATEVVEGATSLPLKTRCTKKRVPRLTTNCTSCGKTFSTYAAFTKHHLAVHPALALPKSRTDRGAGQKQVCEVCGLTLASAWSLVNHLNTHSRDKGYMCNTCGIQLSSRSVLQRHQLTHTQHYVCNECGKPFTHRSGLRLHIRAHNKDARNRKKMPEAQNVLEYFKNYESLANYGR